MSQGCPHFRPPTRPRRPRTIAGNDRGAGEQAAWRFIEFFTVNVRNKNARAARHGRDAVFRLVHPVDEQQRPLRKDRASCFRAV